MAAAAMRRATMSSFHGPMRWLLWLWMMCLLQLLLHTLKCSRWTSINSMSDPLLLRLQPFVLLQTNEKNHTNSHVVDRRTFYDICIVVDEDDQRDINRFRAAIMAERFANLRGAKVLILLKVKKEFQGTMNETIINNASSSLSQLWQETAVKNCSNRKNSLLFQGTFSNLDGQHDLNDDDRRAHQYFQSFWPSDEQMSLLGMPIQASRSANSSSSCAVFQTMVQNIIDHPRIHAAIVAQRNDTEQRMVQTWNLGKVYGTSLGGIDSDLVVVQPDPEQHSANSSSSAAAPAATISATDIFLDTLSWWDAETSPVDLITCRCNEDFAWIEEWQRVFRFRRIFVYNKCDETQTPLSQLLQQNQTIQAPTAEVMEWIHLPNTGREGAAWLLHMLRDDIVLAHRNVFLQGSPEAHLDKVYESLHAMPYIPTSIDGGMFPPFLDLSQHTNDLHDKYQINICWSLASEICGSEFGVPAVCAFHQRYASTERTCEQGKATLRGEFITTAMAIRRHVIARRQVLFEPLLDELNQDNNPAVGHYLERSWGEILSG